jgi:hypothetical protein
MAVMAAFAAMGNITVIACQEVRRCEAAGIRAGMTDTAVRSYRNMVARLALRDIAIVALTTVVAVYADMVKATPSKAGKTASMAIDTISGSGQVIV